MPDTDDSSLRWLRQALGGLFDTGTALIKRGTVLGALIPVVFLVVLACSVLAWLFRDTAVFGDVPVVSTALMLGAGAVVVYYLRYYSAFARSDPDRLQSESYRLERRRMQYLMAKDLSEPAPPEALDVPGVNPAIDHDDGEVGDDPETDAASAMEADR